MTELGSKIKGTLRIKHDSLDIEIEDNIQTCLLLLRSVGISEEKTSEAPEDPLVQKACELYCKWQFNFDGRGESFQKAYEGLRDFMSLGGDYAAVSE